MADSVEMAVRRDAARRRQRREEFFDARDRGQLAGERYIDIGPERIEKPALTST